MPAAGTATCPGVCSPPRSKLISSTARRCQSMVRKVAYWATTALVAAMGAFGGFMYLTGSPEAVEGFRHVGYPQQLRILLGIAKALGAITLVAPGFPMLKEWAY